MSKTPLVAVALALLSSSALADDLSPRTPHRFWLAPTGGMVMSAVEGDEYTTLEGAAGVDVGFQRLGKNSALVVDADLLPISGHYRARGSLLLGGGFTHAYWLPCAAPAGMTCTLIYPNRKVRTVGGFKVGGEVMHGPRGDATIVDVGAGLRGQYLVEMTFSYDPMRATKGMSFDFAAQMGPVRMNLETSVMFSQDHPRPLLMLFSIGYTPSMW